MRFQNTSERRIRGFLTGAAAALTVLAGITACSSGAADEERGEPVAAQGEAESTAHPAEGPLDDVMKEKADEGKGFSLRDATDLNRYVSPAHAEKFKVCFEEEKPNLRAVVLFTVRSSETCPPKVGAEWKADATPDVVGMDLRKATDRLVLTGYTPQHIHVDATGGTVTKERSWSYKVCTQSPAVGTPSRRNLSRGS
ncbi:PASTA domain-containing protein [Streptomyces tuirus]|uniref:PASTA domain-containing protein n=1 Tax=Streptomyces tuirus TaxID=68278 RepID=A0A941FMV0_9ACTN|nr:PASTA domain-containing protein [Streptomyces tuirus]